MRGLSQVRNRNVFTGLCACMLGILGWGFGLQPAAYQFLADRLPGFESDRLNFERQRVSAGNPPILDGNTTAQSTKTKDPVDLLEQSFKVHRAFAISS